MDNKNFKKENDEIYEINQTEGAKIDKIISDKTEKSEEQDFNLSANQSGFLANIRRNISSVAIFILLVLSLIQSFEILNLKKEIEKGQFTGNASVAPAASQGLPEQQGGC